MIIRVTDPLTFRIKMAEARRLRKQGKKVIIWVDDLDALCKVYDTEVICDMLNGIPLHVEIDEENLKVRDEKETNQGTRSQADGGVYRLLAETARLEEL